MKNKTIFKINSNLEFELVILKNVFYPTYTSKILINSCLKKIKKKSKILDLGCGSGIVGISLFKKGFVKEPLYFSDVSRTSIKNVKINATLHNINVIAKASSLFSSWKGYKFDYIINDVAGISEIIASKSQWYKKISCKTGKSGTDLVNKIISQSKKYLNKNGSLIMPTISLSNEKIIMKHMKKHFNKIDKISSVDWPLPKNMYTHEKLINDLKKKSFINFKKKWGLIICNTSVYMLKN